MRDEEEERVTSAVRESVLWYLRRGLEGAVERQRELVERRVERVREKERSVLYKHVSGSGSGGQQHLGGTGGGLDVMMMAEEEGKGSGSREEEDDIKNQLSAEQLQLFEDENQSMLRYYEDTLSKVRYVFGVFLVQCIVRGMANKIYRHAEKSLLDISSLQQSLVSHLATQEDFIGQLVTDAGTTQTNIGGGNKELKRATESRSTAQAVFWGTVGLCTWLVVWDLVF